MTPNARSLTNLALAGALSLLAAAAAAQQPTTGTPARPAGRSAPPAVAPGPAPVTTATGLVFRSVREGRGTAPAATDRVKVHYRGTLADGKEFDSSYGRGQPAVFPLNRVIPCWTEGLQRMKPGAKAVLTCPPAIAYGERGAGGVIPPNATLTFEVELIEVNPAS